MKAESKTRNEIQYDVEIANRILKSNLKKDGMDFSNYERVINLLIDKHLLKDDRHNTAFANNMVECDIDLTISDFRDADENSGIARLKANVANAILEVGRLTNATGLATKIANVYNETIKIVAKELTDLEILRRGALTGYSARMKNDGKMFVATDFTNIVYSESELKECDFGNVSFD